MVISTMCSAPACPVGQQAARYPEWVGSFIATYDFDTPLGGAYARGELFYTGSYYDEITNLAEVPNATEINLRAGVRMDSGMGLEACVSNLLDEDAPTGGNNIADTSQYVRDFCLQLCGGKCAHPHARSSGVRIPVTVRLLIDQFARDVLTGIPQGNNTEGSSRPFSLV